MFFSDEINCSLYYNVDGETDFPKELSVFNNLHDDHKLSEKTGQNLFVSLIKSWIMNYKIISVVFVLCKFVKNNNLKW